MVVYWVYMAGFGRGGATAVASMRSCQKAPQHLAEPMPDGSRMDMPLARGGPIRNDSNASGIMYFRRKQKLLGRCNYGQRRGG